MNVLTYPGEPDRHENDPAVMGKLIKKGWTETGVYVPSPPSAEQVEANRKAAIASAAQSLVDSTLGAGGERALLHIMMRAVNRVRKEGKGRANAADTAELDALEAAADRIELIRAEETRLLSDQALTIANANWPA